MKNFFAWLDQRTGCKNFTDALFFQSVPGGARWRYVWGATVLFCIGIQFITGIALWMGYSPGVQTAWESVNYLQNDVAGGWLLRGLHHYTAQILPIIMALYLMQMVIDRVYQSPREVNFWTGLLLMQVVLLMALTGYQLPWDQKGFWATKVAMNIMGIVPIIGPSLQRILIGGPDYGQLTLTRFFAVHAGILPGTLLTLIVIHLYLSRRNKIKGLETSSRPPVPFWPDQALRNAVAWLAVMITLMFLILRHQIFHSPGALGAELSAPADPSEPYSAARPEWYFLFLYQSLKYFPAQMEIVGAIIIPGLVVGVIVMMPFIGRSRTGQRFNVGFLACLYIGIGLLTYTALAADRKNPDYQIAVINASRDSERIRELTDSPQGVPITGALSLLRNDPLTQGPKLFARNCASCHRYNGHDGTGHIGKDAQSASDLAGFGSRDWLGGLLDPAQVDSLHYFGGTKFKEGKMVKFVKKDVAAYSPAEKEQLNKVIAAVSAEAKLKSQANLDQKDAAQIVEGRGFMKDAMRCTECHAFHAKDDDATGPDLTGYASRAWLIKFISNPKHAVFYGERNDRMPAFGDRHILTPQAIGMIADWLRGDWYVPKSGEVPAVAQKEN